MRNFITYIIKLTLFVTFLFVPILFTYNLNTKNNIHELRRDQYKCEEIVFMGSSHGRDAFNPNIIKNSYNLSESGFSFEETFKEIKETVLRNCDNSVKVVVISFSVFSLRNTNLLPRRTNVKFNTIRNPNVLLDFFLNENRSSLIGFNFLEDPKFRNQNIQITEEQIKKFYPREFNTHTNDISEIRYGQSFFNEIIKLKKKLGFRLIFIVTPFVREYNSLLNEYSFWEEDKSVMRKFHDDGTIEFYDYSSFFISELNHYSYFVDSSHLSEKGSKIFTEKIKIDLNFNLE